jgi:poly(A) polymerase
MLSLDPTAIDPDADRVVRKITRQGHKAYLVGGCVRDLLLGRKPKDFDVATSATPNEVKAIFRNCRIIGRRFRLATVFFGDKIIETATFRANPREDEEGEGADLLIRRDNVFGNETEDARRRDFTINGLFYDLDLGRVIDHVGGLADLDAGLIRTIGDPQIRFQEDPVRMLRAVKFAARLGFTLEPSTRDALVRWRHEIRKSAPPRVLEEVFRLLRSGVSRRSMELLSETGLLSAVSHQLSDLFEAQAAGTTDDEEPVTLDPEGSDGDEGSDEGSDKGSDDDGELVAMDREEASWHQVWADSDPTPRKRQHPAPARTVVVEAEAEGTEGAEAWNRRRERAWSVLGLLDQAVTSGHEPTTAMVLAALICPFVYEELTLGRPGQSHALIHRLAEPLVSELRVPRKDSERLRQLLLSLRRIATAKQRGETAELLGGREFFDDAMLLYELAEGAAGNAKELLLPVPASDDEDSEEGAPKRRRRRRGGRRRRREPSSPAHLLR